MKVNLGNVPSEGLMAVQGSIEIMTEKDGNHLGICRGEKKFRCTHMPCWIQVRSCVTCRFTYLEPSMFVPACAYYLPPKPAAGYEGHATIEIALQGLRGVNIYI